MKPNGHGWAAASDQQRWAVETNACAYVAVALQCWPSKKERTSVTETICFNVFEQCVKAIQNGELIESESEKDKEFHFQNWFKLRLEGSAWTSMNQVGTRTPIFVS
jgi:hypothetical protein